MHSIGNKDPLQQLHVQDTVVKHHGAGSRGPDSGMGLPAALGGHSRLWSVAPTYGMAIMTVLQVCYRDSKVEPT